MDKSIICQTCGSGPFLKTSTDILNFHTNQDHILVEYDPKIHEPILGNCVDKDEFDKEAFMEGLRNSRLLEHKTIEGDTLLIRTSDIKVLRPNTLDSGSKYILTQIPTDRIDSKGKKTSIHSSYFIVKHGDGHKEILSCESEKLTQDFVIRVKSSYTECRWNRDDLLNYCKEAQLIDPKKVFDNSISDVKQYFEYKDEASYSVFVLWNIATYFNELFNSFPYLDFTGTKRAGKTKNLDYQKIVCYNAIKSSDISASAQFRIIDSMGCTILFDETEHMKNPKSEKHQDTLTLLHTGFMKGDSAIRSEGKNFTPTEFRTYGPKALAHINSFSDVLEDRCIPFEIIRSTNDKILNSEPDKSDKQILELRNWYYRLFLDYADEVYSLIKEAREILDVSSRELKIWTPIITLALFFEKHGVEGLTKVIKAKSEAVNQERNQNDEEHSPEGRFLKFVDKELRDIPKKDGWLQHKEIYNIFRTKLDEYGFESWDKERFVSDKLKQLGFKKGRKGSGFHYNLSDKSINEALERFNIPYQSKLEDKDVK